MRCSPCSTQGTASWWSTISSPGSTGRSIRAPRWSRPISRMTHAVRGAIRDHDVGAIMHFAGSIIVPEIGERPAQILSQQHRREPRADRKRGGVRREAFHLLLDRRDLRHARARAGRRGRPDRADQSLWHVEADDRGDAARRRRGASDQLLRAALFQRRRRRPAGPLGPVDRRRDAPDQGRGRGGDWQARAVSACSAPISTRPTAPACATISMSATSPPRMSHALELLSPSRAESHTLNAGYGRGFSVLEVLDAVDRVTNMTIDAPDRGPPRGRSGRAGRRQSRDPGDARLAAAARRSRHDRRAMRWRGNASWPSGDSDLPGRADLRPFRTSCVDGSRIASGDVMFWRLVGCSLVFGLLMRLSWTAGPDGFRGRGPTLLCGL